MKKVAILLSTYNGEKYLYQQLESLAWQVGVHITVFMRDDGSSDDTVKLAERYLRELKNKYTFDYHIDTGINIGFVKSFFTLVEDVPSDFDYYAFADQDDVWLENKMIAGIKMIGEKHDSLSPVAYACRPEAVDEKLNHIKYFPKVKHTSFTNSLFQNNMAGCCTIINRSGIKLLKENINWDTTYHDWWVYVLFSGMGHVIIDNNYYIKYRQHGKNTVGAERKKWLRYKNRFINLQKDNRISKNTSQLVENFSYVIPEKHKRLLNIFYKAKNNILYRLYFIVISPKLRESFLENILMKGMILWGRY